MYVSLHDIFPPANLLSFSLSRLFVLHLYSLLSHSSKRAFEAFSHDDPSSGDDFDHDDHDDDEQGSKQLAKEKEKTSTSKKQTKRQKSTSTNKKSKQKKKKNNSKKKKKSAFSRGTGDRAAWGGDRQCRGVGCENFNTPAHNLSGGCANNNQRKVDKCQHKTRMGNPQERRFCVLCGGKNVCKHGRRQVPSVMPCKLCDPTYEPTPHVQGPKPMCNHGRDRGACSQCKDEGIGGHRLCNHRTRNATYQLRSRCSKCTAAAVAAMRSIVNAFPSAPTQ